MLLHLHFSGGLELLFGNEKQKEVQVPCTSQALIIKELLVWMRETILTERPELFLKDDSVRPGILVLINDTDWEITGHLDTELADGDTLAFISTLHGG
mmetsp:Transcript_26982/g.69293  ORF Transcript_26982/g.69293 Transcript_26982/m.69293 type:complete len:98 (-) Transcript_26982:1644-1937(-)|eukprot:jgi/Tetstr1/426603/TSEL_016880.t1